MSEFKNVISESLLEQLRQKNILTDLDKDILSTWDVYHETPFDRKRAERKIVENNLKYADIFVDFSATYGIGMTPLQNLNDESIKCSLWIQLEGMWMKENPNIKGNFYYG